MKKALKGKSAVGKYNLNGRWKWLKI